MTQEKQNQTPVSAKAGQENCPLCEVSPETIEKLKNQSERSKNQKPEKNGFWKKLFTPRHSEVEGRRIQN